MNVNAPLIEISMKGVYQPAPYVKEQVPPGDPFERRGKRQFNNQKYANSRLANNHPTSLNIGQYSSARIEDGVGQPQVNSLQASSRSKSGFIPVISQQNERTTHNAHAWQTSIGQQYSLRKGED